MNEFDDVGWNHIHHCAFRGYVKSLERFVENDENMLELMTKDGLFSTPFLLAVSSGMIDTVELLVKLGAKLDVHNSLNQGAVEICASKGFMTLLEYFILRDFENLRVWKILFKMLCSNTEDKVESAGACLRHLTAVSSTGVNSNWEPFYRNGGVKILIKVLHSIVIDESKLSVLQVLINVIEKSKIQEQLIECDGIPMLLKLVMSKYDIVVQYSATVLKTLAKTTTYSALLQNNGMISKLQLVMSNDFNPDVQAEVVQLLSNMAAVGGKHQKTILSFLDCVKDIVSLYKTAVGHSKLTISLSEVVTNFCRISKDIQSAFVNAGVAPHIIDAVINNTRDKQIQEAAVQAMRFLVTSNHYTQSIFLDHGADQLMLLLLKKHSSDSLKEMAALVVWELTGDDIDDKREMANSIGVHTLIGFITSSSTKLHLIGSEGLGVLAQGPMNLQTDIGQCHWIHHLVELLQSSVELVVLSSIRALRSLCVSVGNVPNRDNQSTVAGCHGVTLLVTLAVRALSQRIQAEAALTLACVRLGNLAVMKEIQTTNDFGYLQVINMMHAEDEGLRLLAGSTLAMFSYNNVCQQREITKHGGVHFSWFANFLKTKNLIVRCHAAYQVIVLARLIPDNEQAKSALIGIKILVDILEQSTDKEVLSLAACFIACLAHTRAGVPSAIVSVGAVEYLCRLLLSKSAHARGCAAIALGYLSYDRSGERQLLYQCRKNPYLVQTIKHYTKSGKLSQSFLQGWMHYKKVGLPPMTKKRHCLVQVLQPRDDKLPTIILNLKAANNNMRNVNSLKIQP